MSSPSYAHGTSTVSLLGETIGDNLRRTVEGSGATEALVAPFQGFRATYREFWALTDRAAKGFLARGVNKGDRVGIWSPNRFEWTVIQYATARIGAILVNINPAYKAAELEYVLNQSRHQLFGPGAGLPHQRLRGAARRGQGALPGAARGAGAGGRLGGAAARR